jgi:hypothetical protein
MAYRVEIATNAEAELEELYLWVVGRVPSPGATWFSGLERAILVLEQFPRRFRIARESLDLDQPVRVFHYGAALTFIAWSSQWTTVPNSCGWCTFGEARGEDRRRLS